MPKSGGLLACVDVLIVGRYVAAERVARGLRGSANKTIHLLTDRYTLANLEATPEAEIVLRPDGELVLSGINPFRG